MIVCTFNRCQILSSALESVAASQLPGYAEWEVLVVDNNSRDQTFSVVDEFCKRFPGRFRYLFESQPGKSHALNRGIREARGDILAFMDDDVIVETAWLLNLTISLGDSQWIGAGGKTLPAQNVKLPRWLGFEPPYNMGGVLCAYFNLGDEACELHEAPYGANMAFRKEAFEKYGGFRIDLGPQPGSELRNEDTEFGRRVLAAGERLRYEPSAVVYHPVPVDRMRKDYFLAWYFDFGRANVREWEPKPDILGIPRRCFNFIRMLGTVLPVRTVRWLITLNPKRRFFRKCWLWTTVGQMVECRRQWRDAAAQTHKFTKGVNRG